VEKIKDFQAKLTDFLTTRKADLLAKIRNEKSSAMLSQRN